jgi:hypothetical protein
MMVRLLWGVGDCLSVWFTAPTFCCFFSWLCVCTSGCMPAVSHTLCLLLPCRYDQQGTLSLLGHLLLQTLTRKGHSEWLLAEESADPPGGFPLIRRTCQCPPRGHYTLQTQQAMMMWQCIWSASRFGCVRMI